MNKTLLGLLTVGVIVGCGSSNLNPPAVEPTYSSIRTLILGPRCLRCHGDFSEYPNLLATGYVIPGDPLTSKLYVEVALGEMPKNGPKLSDAEILAIENWIEQGAKP